MIWGIALTKYAHATGFPSDEIVIRRIVRAIQKAVEEDVLEFCREHPMETMNSVRYIRGDKINENLRALVVSDDVILISFKRYSWDVRMLADLKNHITYTVTTEQNLIAIPKKKNRTYPHFLQSTLFVENGDLEGACVQMSLMPMEQFDDNVLEDDYKKIVAGVIDPDSGYRHYVVTYAFEKGQLLRVSMELLDKGFNKVSSLSLNNFIVPDFTRLTAEQLEGSEETVEPVKTARDLVAIKKGIRPELIKLEEEKRV